MKKWLTIIASCLLLIVAATGVALAHDRHDYRHGHYRDYYHYRHHYYNHHRYDHHRHHHDWYGGGLVIKADLSDDVSIIWVP